MVGNSGWMAEWLKATVLKTVLRGIVTWVRIPLHPLVFTVFFHSSEFGRLAHILPCRGGEVYRYTHTLTITRGGIMRLLPKICYNLKKGECDFYVNRRYTYFARGRSRRKRYLPWLESVSRSTNELVESISDDVIQATLPLLPRKVTDMVQLQRLTGMRSTKIGE